jgi:hypothetical protein
MTSTSPELGSPEAVYVASFWRPFAFAALGLTVIALGVLLVGVPLLAGESIVSFFIAILCCSMPGILVSLIGLWLCLDAFGKVGIFSVLVYREGLVVRRFWYRQFYPWEDAEIVWNRGNHAHLGGTNMTFCIYTVYWRGLGNLSLAHMPGLRKLGRTIEEESSLRLLPRYLERFRDGNNIYFGEQILVNSEGVMLNPYSLRIPPFSHEAQIERGVPPRAFPMPWADIKKISFRRDSYDGAVIVSAPNKEWPNRGVAVSSNKVPNLLLMIRLLRAIKPDIVYSGNAPEV